MSNIQPGGEHIVRKLRQAIERLQDDIARVQLWADALNGFSQPVPDYGHGQTRFDLPPTKATESRSQKPTHRRTIFRGGQTDGNGEPNSSH
jgi:hypothetical protein